MYKLLGGQKKYELNSVFDTKIKKKTVKYKSKVHLNYKEVGQKSF